jgi:hypothetical protein
MLEPYALKGACTVLRGGGEGYLTSLPDVRAYSPTVRSSALMRVSKSSTYLDRLVSGYGLRLFPFPTVFHGDKQRSGMSLLP